MSGFAGLNDSPERSGIENEISFPTVNLENGNSSNLSNGNGNTLGTICDECDEPATYGCVTCSPPISLCDFHQTAHGKSKKTQRHALLTIQLFNNTKNKTNQSSKDFIAPPTPVVHSSNNSTNFFPNPALPPSQSNNSLNNNNVNINMSAPPEVVIHSTAPSSLATANNSSYAQALKLQKQLRSPAEISMSMCWEPGCACCLTVDDLLRDPILRDGANCGSCSHVVGRHKRAAVGLAASNALQGPNGYRMKGGPGPMGNGMGPQRGMGGPPGGPNNYNNYNRQRQQAPPPQAPVVAPAMVAPGGLCGMDPTTTRFSLCMCLGITLGIVLLIYIAKNG